MDVRVVGLGPESAALAALRACPGVVVENRWVAETAIADLLAWSDAIVLPYREASQSGVAAAALAAGRPVIATRVGGLAEQLAGWPHTFLCEPDAASLAASITAWLTAPTARPPAIDAQAAWQAASAGLLEALAPIVTHHSPRRALRDGAGTNIIGARTEGSPCPSALSVSTLAKP
jgi:glycosyltransferase involved in cell wall biosynthesis